MQIVCPFVDPFSSNYKFVYSLHPINNPIEIIPSILRLSVTQTNAEIIDIMGQDIAKMMDNKDAIYCCTILYTDKPKPTEIEYVNIYCKCTNLKALEYCVDVIDVSAIEPQQLEQCIYNFIFQNEVVEDVRI
jgi:hypothetical protein